MNMLLCYIKYNNKNIVDNNKIWQINTKETSQYENKSYLYYGIDYHHKEAR